MGPSPICHLLVGSPHTSTFLGFLGFSFSLEQGDMGCHEFSYKYHMNPKRFTESNILLLLIIPILPLFCSTSMEKDTIELNLDGWVLLPDNKSSLMEFSHDGKEDFFKDSFFYPEGIIYMNYIDNYHSTDRVEENSSPANETNQVLAPILTEPDVEKNPDDILAKEFKDIAVVLPEVEFAQDIVSKIFYKRMTEPESFDLEIEPEPIQLEEEEEAYNLPQKYLDSEIKGIGCNLGRWGRRGIGALCSIGVTAATLSILLLGGGQQQKNRNQRIYFQIYTADKRMKQVVQQASRLNQAMSALRGSPVVMTAAAQLSFGGFYDGF